MARCVCVSALNVVPAAGVLCTGGELMNVLELVLALVPALL